MALTEEDIAGKAAFSMYYRKRDSEIAGFNNCNLDRVTDDSYSVTDEKMPNV